MYRRKVSLIIPVYNTEEHLEKCLTSAVLQTYENMEIICVDDGSTDDSGRLVDEFAKQDKRVIGIHQKNKGESNARNTGLRIASGDYIGFMDCDDWIEPDMYEELVNALECENADMAISGFYKEFEGNGKTSVKVKNEKNVEPKVFGKEMLLRYLYERDSYRAFAYIWDKLYKREVLYQDGKKPVFFDETIKLGGDVLFLAQCALRTNRAVYLDMSFYHYLQREDSGCYMPDLERRMDNIRAYKIVKKEFEENQVDPFILDLIKRIMVYHSSNTAELALELQDGKILETCQQLMKKYEKEYRVLNGGRREWIRRFEDILQYKI